MKFNFFFLLFFLFNLSNVCAQDYIELPQSYFLDQSNLDDGKPLSIKMFINFHLKSMIESDSVKNLKGKDLSDYYDQAFKSKVVEIKPGIYFIDNDKQNFKFSIDNNGLLAGDGLLNNRVKNTETTFKFSSGIAINTVTKRLDKIYSRTTLKDSIFVAELFDKDGMMVTKDIINLKLGGGQSNTISTHYSKNGKISSEQNNINETFIVYYENGKIERQTDKKENWGKEFDKTGKMESQYYTKDNQRCVEEYTNGLIITKECRGEREDKKYYYKNGKLDFYEVHDNTSNSTKVYDAKGKVLNKESIMDKVPTIGN